MKLSDFDFDLPRRLIAQTPARPRDHARLLIYDRGTKKIIDDHFYNLEKYLPLNSTLVLNNSKVEKCRLRFGSTELFVLETINPTTLRALVRPGKKFRVDEDIDLGAVSVKTLAIDDAGIRTLELSLALDSPDLDSFRLTPLPPYIAQNEDLSEEYQTIYANSLGSKAAPTAGLHFTADQLNGLRQHHPIAEVTLHVGLGTFAPIKTENIIDHQLHYENFVISKTAAHLLNSAIHRTAVGTTSVRVLETVGLPFKEVVDSTNIFIMPGHKFKVVDSLVTNFHLPKSSLLMLISAFMGSVDEMQAVYAHAIEHDYRFYSFGDAMLIR